MNILPKVLVNSIPKSGTHLLLQLVLGIPGMSITPKWITSIDDLQLIQPGFVGPAHLPCVPGIKQGIKQKKIKMIFIYRDLRDNLISLVHFIMKNQFDHPWHPYIANTLKTHEERITALIKGYEGLDRETGKLTVIWNIRRYAVDMVEWLHDPHVCAVRYEDLVSKSNNDALMKIVDFLWEDLTSLHLGKDEIIQRMKNNNNPRQSGTFRKGSVGDWKKEFTENHKLLFKQVAGDLLIKLGYEKDYNW